MDQIDKYLIGKLVDDDLNTFLSELKEDKELVAELESRYHISLASKESVLQDKLILLKQYEKALVLEEKHETHAENIGLTSNPAKVVRFGYSRIIGLAASVLMMLGVGWYFTSQNTELDEKYAMYFEPYPSNVSITRSASSDVDQLTQSAHGLYQNGNYDQAAPLFEQLYKRDLDTMALFYAGVSYVGAKDLKNAKRILKNPINWKVKKLYLKQIEKILD